MSMQIRIRGELRDHKILVITTESELFFLHNYDKYCLKLLDTVVAEVYFFIVFFLKAFLGGSEIL